MRVLSWEELRGSRSESEPVALTIGVFDGLHTGHRRLIEAVVRHAGGLVPAVCTFRQNPAGVLSANASPASILSVGQKLERLSALGVGLVVLIDFSVEFSKLTGKSFLQTLRSRLELRKVAVGYNFHMGRGRDTGPGQLRAMLDGTGVELEVVPAATYRGEPVSSSRIRAAVRDGRFQEARDMLEAPFCLDLRGVQVTRWGGAAAVARERVAQVLPLPGEYAVRLHGSAGWKPGTLAVTQDSIGWQTDLEQEEEICFGDRVGG